MFVLLLLAPSNCIYTYIGVASVCVSLISEYSILYFLVLEVCVCMWLHVVRVSTTPPVTSLHRCWNLMFD